MKFFRQMREHNRDLLRENCSAILQENRPAVLSRIDLQLFGDDGSVGAAASGNSSDGAAVPDTEKANTDSAPSFAAKQTEVKDKAARVLYGKQRDLPDISIEQDAQHTDPSHSSKKELVTKEPQNGSLEEETFDDLINGKYKEDFQKHLDRILQKRFKNSAALEEQAASMRELLENTARRYGIDPESETLLDDIRKAQDNDDEIYAKEAYDHNMSVEDYKRSLEKEREIKALSQKVKENEEREQKRAWIQELRAQVPQVQKIFPSFDLDEEMKNPNFAYLVRPGSPTSIEDAMYAVHHREILSGAVKTAAQQAAQKTANAVAANKLRPKEGGLSSIPPVVVKSDPSKWTKEDRAEIRRRVARGERIEL